MPRPAPTVRRAPPPPTALTPTQLEKWRDLHATISRNHGAVVSRPNEQRMRFHCEGWNPLPELLREDGYSVIPAGTAEVLWPFTEPETGIQHVRPGAVHVFELTVEK
jgi:hypothetical protein